MRFGDGEWEEWGMRVEKGLTLFRPTLAWKNTNESKNYRLVTNLLRCSYLIA